ncbi:MAG: hypothetical protein WC494_03395 [Candidatus Pacearchaeota archaeon]
MYSPVCRGAETHLVYPIGEIVVKSFLGHYKGDRQGLIKVRPLNPEILAGDSEAVRYVVVDVGQVEKIDRYVPRQIFP